MNYKVFANETSEMKVYVNNDNDVYIDIAFLDNPDNFFGYITLNKSDVIDLIEQLKKCVTEIEEFE